MSSFFYMVVEIVASHSVAVTVAVLLTATLVLLVVSGAAGRAALRIEERFDGFV